MFAERSHVRDDRRGLAARAASHRAVRVREGQRREIRPGMRSQLRARDLSTLDQGRAVPVV
jgi:hypothetical protein